ncbi:hypothetical protein HMPREF3198_01737 [Winkia neuii]|nr:hypothetical protein HMPREF3198_01737 [Winkia neuii]
MAVLIALTLGVILGAGPLQGPLSSALTGQVNRLTEQQATLNEQLSEAHKSVQNSDSYVNGLAAAVLPGSLKDQKVGLIVLPGAEADDVKTISDKLGQAGAKVVGQVSLEADWFTQSRESYRKSLVSSITSYLETAPEGGASTGAIMGSGAVQLLTAPGDKSNALAEVLTAKSAPLATITKNVSEPAKSVVVIGPRNPDAVAKNGKKAGKTYSDDSVTGLAQAVAKSPESGVLVGSAAAEDCFIAKVRAGGVSVATVDSISQISAAVSTPLALSAAKAGHPGAFGFQTGADKPLPPVKAQ